MSLNALRVWDAYMALLFVVVFLDLIEKVSGVKFEVKVKGIEMLIDANYFANWHTLIKAVFVAPAVGYAFTRVAPKRNNNGEYKEDTPPVFLHDCPLSEPQRIPPKQFFKENKQKAKAKSPPIQSPSSPQGRFKAKQVAKSPPIQTEPVKSLMASSSSSSSCFSSSTPHVVR